ncbi:MAG: hypothetical protein GY792_11005 [Gammaproteobacteria bacterium]|nr:hypothetical protein [Gammaproteobacteria bacterium]
MKDATERYRTALRKKHWRAIPASTLVRCYRHTLDIGALPKSELIDSVVRRCNGDVTSAEVNKALGLLLKAGLFRYPQTDEDKEVLWQSTPLSEAEMLYAVDLAMLVRLLAGLEEEKITLEQNGLAPLFLGKHSDSEINNMLEDAQHQRRDGSEPG